MTGVLAWFFGLLSLVCLVWAVRSYVQLRQANRRLKQAWQELLDSGELDTMDPDLRDATIALHDLSRWFPRRRRPGQHRASEDGTA